MTSVATRSAVPVYVVVTVTGLPVAQTGTGVSVRVGFAVTGTTCVSVPGVGHDVPELPLTVRVILTSEI